MAAVETKCPKGHIIKVNVREGDKIVRIYCHDCGRQVVLVI